ncbi:unnamed protein product [Medioppia subpectinata]|uniref:RHD domain-containing protein n=1 Tax=Medioppia subpectinata TaxID=1979941 RepID=A0A7R9L286_9ACAR|nr:unnamed protein product [Medioppia subpectinata]CAG2113000.1 unnamed protein product [Medioppia subpectinata]
MSVYGEVDGCEPYVRIVEQPARSAVRFRYECEGRSAGPIPGVSSTPSCATYPTIQIVGYGGSRAMVVVSCVTVSQPYRQHPHHLVGRVGCHQGVCTMIVDNSDHLCSFTHLGIQCAKRNEIAARLKLRKQLRIDPTFGGFDHIMKSSRSLDLGAIRLCFQVYVEDPITRKFTKPLEPVVSDAVYDKKLLPKLIITDISTTSCRMTGGKVMLFCNYIDEEDIEVRFYETDAATGLVVWESIADLKPPVGEVHKRVGISLMAPPYPRPECRHPVDVYLQLRRPSDQRASEAMIFTYLPECQFPNCPLLQYNRLHNIIASESVSTSALTTTYNTITTAVADQPQHQVFSRRGRAPKSTANDNNQSTGKKRVKVLDVLNGSDSDGMEETEADDHDVEERDVFYNQFYANNNNVQYFGQNCLKPDVNNNSINANIVNNNTTNGLLSIKCEPNIGNQQLAGCPFAATPAVGNASNDLLMECLKTIDIDCLAAMQFQADYQHNTNSNHNNHSNSYTADEEEEWHSFDHTVSQHYNENYAYSTGNNVSNNNIADNCNTNSEYNECFNYYQTQPPIDSQDKLSFIDL